MYKKSLHLQISHTPFQKKEKGTLISASVLSKLTAELSGGKKKKKNERECLLTSLLSLRIKKCALLLKDVNVSFSLQHLVNFIFNRKKKKNQWNMFWVHSKWKPLLIFQLRKGRITSKALYQNKCDKRAHRSYICGDLNQRRYQQQPNPATTYFLLLV